MFLLKISVLFLIEIQLSTCNDCGNHRTLSLDPLAPPQVSDTYPWKVVLYKKENFICGGSLIRDNAILTSAACVTTNHNGTINDIDDFAVGVGKLHVGYNDNRDISAQYSNLKSIHIPSIFRGQLRNYADDIAILITSKKFTMSSEVRPICIDWRMNEIKPNALTYAIGWGLDFNDKISDSLKKSTLLTIPTEKCISHLPENFLVYFTSDKFCTTKTENSTANVCRGDQGDGIIWTDNQRDYIIGIVSLAPRVEKCIDLTYALNTNILNHLNFINHTLTTN